MVRFLGRVGLSTIARRTKPQQHDDHRSLGAPRAARRSIVPRSGPISHMTTDDASALWRRAREAISGTRPQRGAPARSPVARYLDPARHAREVAVLRAWPHAVAPVAQLAAPGDWLGTSVLGVPLLLVRADDGVLRAFIGVCRHRGAVVVGDGDCGHARSRFVCPYHSWTYDSHGHLVGRPHDADFPHVARADASLVELPVAERCGLVWVVPSPNADFDWDDYFGSLALELGGLGYDSLAASPQQRRVVHASNWKLVLDANLESYHFQYAHRATIAHLFHDNLVQQESFGRHQRIVLAKRSLVEADPADTSWTLLGRHSNIIYFFFPATFLLWEGDHVNGFNVTPLSPDRSTAASWMLVPPAQAHRPALHWQRNWRIFWDAIDEDSPSPHRCSRAWRAAPTRPSPSVPTSSRAISSSARWNRSRRRRAPRRRLETSASSSSPGSSSPGSCATGSCAPGTCRRLPSWRSLVRTSPSWRSSSWPRSSSACSSLRLSFSLPTSSPAPCRRRRAPRTGRSRSPACGSSPSCRNRRSSAFPPCARASSFRPFRKPSCHTLPCRILVS